MYTGEQIDFETALRAWNRGMWKGEYRWQVKLRMKPSSMSAFLPKLKLSGEEKEQAREDMQKMLDYIDKLDELDTTGVEADVSYISGS